MFSRQLHRIPRALMVGSVWWSSREMVVEILLYGQRGEGHFGDVQCMPEAVTFWLSDLHTRKSPLGICRMRMSVGDVEEFWSSMRSRVIQVMCENSTIAIWLLQSWRLCQGSRSNKSEQDTMSSGSWPQCWVRSVYFQLSHTLPLAWTIAHQAAFRNLEPNMKLFIIQWRKHCSAL